jgi:OmpA-OmpF porin, OOP family
MLVVRQRIVVAVVLAASLGMASGARADDEKHVSGVITERGTQGTLLLQTDEFSSLTVVVDDSTKVRRSKMLKLGSEKLNPDVLIPGLRIKAEGVYESSSIFVAREITVTKEDLRTARAIEGGLAPIDKRVAATVGALHATNARISNLDDYTVIHSMTVYFRNGKADIAPQYMTQLQQFAAQVKEVKGSVVQVQAYASAVGSQRLNQQLSRRRADAVTAILQQNGVTPTELAVPAAMGTTGQVASNETAEGQAQNRRAVITILQNKGVAGQ